ncbi:unnamed protein product, partial [Ectocarpus sp. 12 AP-2014]
RRRGVLGGDAEWHCARGIVHATREAGLPQDLAGDGGEPCQRLRRPQDHDLRRSREGGQHVEFHRGGF